jgi:hypothetical protein
MASEINAELMLEIKGFLEGIKKSQNAATKFSKKGKDGASGWGSALKKVAGGLVAVGKAALKAAAVVAGIGTAVAGAMAAGLKNALDMGGRFSDLAAQMGTTAGRARVLAAAFENNGMQADETAKTVNKMQKSFNDAANGLSTAKRAFGELGLDPEALMTSDPVDAFHTIIDALGGIESESKRTAVAMDIFGRSGGKLNVLLKDKDAMKNARNLIGGQADLLDEHAEKFDRASDVLNQVKTKVQGFFVGVGAKIIEQIMPAIEALNKLDLTGIGERFGAALSGALDIAIAIFKTFRSMSLAEVAKLFGVAIRLGISKAINFFWSGFQAVISAVITYFVEGFKNIIAFVGILATADFWKGMLNAFVGISKVFVGLLLQGAGKLVNMLRDAMGPLGDELIGDSGDALNEVGEGLVDESEDDFANAGKNLEPALDKVGERMRETGRAVAQGFQRGLANATDIIDTSGDEAVMADIAAQVANTAAAIKSDREKKKAETGAAEDEEGSGTTDSGLPKLNSRLAGAINTIAGRSANAVIAAEASKTSANTERTAKAAEEIAKNTANNGGNPRPKPTPVSNMGGKFG